MSDSNKVSVTAIVHIVEARDVVGKDWNNLSDPFVRVLLCGEKRETGIMHATSNALWDQTFVFKDILLNVEQYESEHVYIQVILFLVGLNRCILTVIYSRCMTQILLEGMS
jgi:Ca2+-dependent lipid-binding protein